MSRRLCPLLFLFFTLAVFSEALHAGERNILFREDFDTLDAWRPLNFPKITRHSRYAVVRDGSNNFLMAESNASASGLVRKQEFDVYEYPRVAWRWKVDNVYKKAAPGEKSGDDYPLRVYILFTYDPGHAPVLKKIRYRLAKTVYGEYPPDSSLSYVWASMNHPEKIFTNPYADETKMIVLEAGPQRTGTWIEEEIDIIQDYRKAFGTDPPPVAAIAVMNDSDNTGESSVSYLDFIEVFRPSP